MNSVSAAELADFVKNKAVTAMRIVQNQRGAYQIVVNLNWKEGDLNLVTTRAKPREWASLDRLARHITEKYQVLNAPISLDLNFKLS